MRLTLCLLLALVSSFAAMCQSAAPVANAPLPSLPKEPAAIFAAAAPLYDFSSADMKPWHLKADYQLYDAKGEPSDQGTFEFWWQAPDKFRSSWSRAGKGYSEWRVADQRYHSGSGLVLNLYERAIPLALIAPLPAPSDFDVNSVRMERRDEGAGSVKLPCIMVAPQMPEGKNSWPSIPTGLFPTYCFEPTEPVLRRYYSYGSVGFTYNKIVRTVGRVLAKEVIASENSRKVMTITVGAVATLSVPASELDLPTGLEADRPSPPATGGWYASLDPKMVSISSGVSQGLRAKAEPPIYPAEAKAKGEQGRVILQGIIGLDGRVHEVKVISAPSPLLAEAAIASILRWEYKPFLLNGSPVEVRTTFNVIFQIG